MNLYDKLFLRQSKLAIIGLGYVGLPLAVAFSKKIQVIGFDTNENKIKKYSSGVDLTGEIGDEALGKCAIEYTSDEADLKSAMFHIIAVPTPISSDKTPDLKPIVQASEIVGKYLNKGAYVIYESTVYPGTTEEICIPILEKVSGLKSGIDFKVGYSPERINPGDKVHRLENIVKIVSGMDKESLETIGKVYELIIDAGVYKAESIKIAEAAKVIENSQRDINIAFMNELSMVFNRMEIDTKAVLKAAATKWNFLNFTPGLVGGHCIGVDPYYFIYKAESLGYHSQIILAGRRINDDMGKYIAENTIKQLIKSEIQIKGAKILIIGVTFKENVSDVRNSKVFDIIKELHDYGTEVFLCDDIADKTEVMEQCGMELISLKNEKKFDAIIFAVPHSTYKHLSFTYIKEMYRYNKPVLIDVKSIFDKNNAIREGFIYWSL